MQEPINPLRPISVLVVDDAEDLLQLVCEVLNFNGMKAKGISSGKDLFATLDEGIVDVILMDIRIGEVDGRQLTKRLKADPRYQSVPVLLYSAGLFNEGLHDDSGADGYIAKPFDMEELIRGLRQLVSPNISS